MAASGSLQVTEDLGQASHTNPNFDTGNDSQEGIVDEDEGLPGVCGEQGNKVIFTMGTRELSKKIMGNKGT